MSKSNMVNYYSVRRKTRTNFEDGKFGLRMIVTKKFYCLLSKKCMYPNYNVLSKEYPKTCFYTKGCVLNIQCPGTLEFHINNAYFFRIKYIPCINISM
jgi:hypothetical protein